MNQTRNTYQRSTSWNAQYSFTGKIKDTETGYNYFGARYYDSGLSVWLSVDPLSDKYPTLSPYTYCANNPIMMVDPDGRRIVICFFDLQIEYKNGALFDLKGNPYTENNSFINNVANGLTEIKNNSLFGRAMLTFIEQSDKNVFIESTELNPSCSPTPKSPTEIDYLTIKINPKGYPGYVKNNKTFGPNELMERDIVGDLGHEFSHAFDYLTGISFFNITHTEDELSGWEWLACNRENIIRKDLGKKLKSRYKINYNPNTDSYSPNGPYLLNERGTATKTNYLN